MIAALLAAGHRVGILSNSYKAIRECVRRGVDVHQVKKATSGRADAELQVDEMGDEAGTLPGICALVSGT